MAVSRLKESVLRFGSSLQVGLRRFLGGSLAIAVSLSCVRASESNSVSSIPELFSLSEPELAQGRQFEINGVVLSCDAGWRQLFIESSGNVLYVDPQPLASNFVWGDLVTLQGVTVSGPSPPLTNLHAKITGHSGLPPGMKIGLRDLKETKGRWIELSGEVRVAETSRGRLCLVVSDAGLKSCIEVMGTPPPPTECKAYMGCRVRVTGINVSETKPDGSFAPRLTVPSRAQVVVLSKPDTPVTTLPVLSIESVLNRDLGPWTNAPVHLNGTVSAAAVGKILFLKDPTGQIEARIVQEDQVAPGTPVDLWGYLELSETRVWLGDAFFEPVHQVSVKPSAVLELGHANRALPTVTNLSELRAAPPELLETGIPVRIRGTVIYTDAAWRGAYVYDGKFSAYVDLDQPDVEVGQMVEVTGLGTKGGFAPLIRPAHFRALGETSLPRPTLTDLDEMADGHLDAQWVELEAAVRRASIENGHLLLSLVTSKGKLKAIVPHFPAEIPPANLIDARVRIQGVCGSDTNDRSQVAGITIYIPDMRHLSLITGPAPDPFLAPSIPIEAVGTFKAQSRETKRVKVTGVVTLSLPGQGFFLQDGSGGIRVHTEPGQAIELQPGDVAEVVGYPALGEFSSHLEYPIFHRTGSGALPPPVRTTAENVLLDGTNDCQVIQLEAVLLQRIPRSARPKLLLQRGPLIFSAQLEGNISGAFWGLRAGSLLRLTGVCSIQASEAHSPQSFRLLLHGPNSITLIEAPPLVSPAQVLAVAGLLAAVGLMFLGWVKALRRQVHIRTSELRSSQLSLQSEVERSRTFSELGRRLNAASTQREAAAIIGDTADRLIGWDACLCDMYSSERDATYHVLTIDLDNGKRTEFEPETRECPPSALARRVIETGPQLILRNQSELTEPATRAVGNQQRRSASILYVPIRKSSTVVGLLSIQSYTANAYDQDDLAVLQALADHCGGALDRIRAHQKLVEMSRQAGMAEIASGVLHNVGNVLNSVNVSVALLLERDADSHATRLQRVLDLLDRHSGNLASFLSEDAQGSRVPDYLNHLARAMTASENWNHTELKSLAKHVEHIKQIISMQQSYARLAGTSERVDLVELVEDVLRLTDAGLSRHGIQIQRNYHPVLPTLTLDKHKVLQILINLVRNAKHACVESSRLDKRLVIGIATGANGLRISVADNGVGIPKENLTRIFNMGFTTKKEGHGFGLHSGALAARELGGRLVVNSDGPGTGATFTLELPVCPAQQN